MNKILFTCTSLSDGGAQRVVAVLCSALAELGYDVQLLLYKRKKEEYAISSKVNIIVVPEREKKENWGVYQLRRLFFMRQVFKKNKPDCIIPFLPSQVEHAFFASRGLKCKFILTVRNNPMYDAGEKRKRRDWIAKYVDAIFLQTLSQKKYFEEINLGNKCFVVSNPVQNEILNMQYLERSTIKRLVTMGRLTEQKNHKLLIDAFSKAKKKCPDITLDIYGTGELEENLQKQIDLLKLQEAVRLCGRTNNVAKTLKNYDLFVMSSNFEGMPNALMEAMGVGLPCISTACPTGPDVLIGNDERGRLVSTNNEQELAQAIVDMVENPANSYKKGKLAKQYIKVNYAPCAIAEKLMNEIEKL